MAPTITFDVNSITFGEALAVEKASGQDFLELVKSRMGQSLVAVYLHELRSSDNPRSWHELASLRILDSPFLTSASDSDGPRQKSNSSHSEISPT